MAEQNAKDDGPQPDSFKDRIAPIVRDEMVALFNGEIRPAIVETVKQTFAELQGSIPTRDDMTSIAGEQAQAMFAAYHQEQQRQQEAELAAVATAGESAQGGDPGPSNAVNRGLGRLVENPEILDKLVVRLFDRFLGSPEDANPFALARKLASEHPDVASFYAQQWAPDPLSGQIDMMLAQNGVKVWDTATRTAIEQLRRAGYKLVPPAPPTPSEPPLPPSNVGTVSSAAQPSAPAEQRNEKPTGVRATLSATARMAA
jgi:hypothetical protein